MSARASGPGAASGRPSMAASGVRRRRLLVRKISSAWTSIVGSSGASRAAMPRPGASSSTRPRVMPGSAPSSSEGVSSSAVVDEEEVGGRGAGEASGRVEHQRLIGPAVLGLAEGQELVEVAQRLDAGEWRELIAARDGRDDRMDRLGAGRQKRGGDEECRRHRRRRQQAARTRTARKREADGGIGRLVGCQQIPNGQRRHPRRAPAGRARELPPASARGAAQSSGTRPPAARMVSNSPSPSSRPRSAGSRRAASDRVR